MASMRVPPRRDASESEFDEWVAHATERADPVMAWLGVVFALLVGYEIAVDLSPRTARVVEIVGWAIWAAFALEFVAKLWLAPRRARFLRRNWFQLVALAIPTLRVLRFLRLLRIGRALPAARVVTSSYRSVGTARRLFQSRLGYLAASAVVVAIASAELVFLFERGARGTGLDSFGDALLWAAAAVVALQADPVPVTTAGRLVMLATLAFGLVVVASLAGTVGAFLVEERRERATREE